LSLSHQKLYHSIARIAGGLLVFASVVFSIFNITSRFDAEFRSPFDEQAHFDYWWKIYQNHRMPDVYEPLYFESLRTWTCTKEQKISDEAFCQSDNTGFTSIENTASPYLPTFYVVTAGIAAIINKFSPQENLFHLAKKSTLTLGILCILLLWATCTVLKLPLPLTALTIFATAQNPSFVFAAISFNQELLILAACLLGIMLYLKSHPWTDREFAVALGIFCALSMTIKPTALLLPVIIGFAELLAFQRSPLSRVKRFVAFSTITLIAFWFLQSGINAYREINPSDGIMREALIKLRGDSDFISLTGMVWAHFTRSTASLHWRHLVDWDLPWLFPHMHIYLLGALAIALLHLIFSSIQNRAPLDSSRMFVGSMVAFVALPLSLAAFLYIQNFPFFFQPRYYTAYTIIGVLLATAFLHDLAKSSIQRFIQSRHVKSDR
jgi:hypothetical protein